jgi:hypothetical protein
LVNETKCLPIKVYRSNQLRREIVLITSL